MKPDRFVRAFFIGSPRLSLDYSLSCEIRNRNAMEIEDGHHEFRVISVNESKPRLIVEYIRSLPASEWRWF